VSKALDWIDIALLNSSRPSGLTACSADRGWALRHSRSVTANQLLELLGQPLVATSANISGSPTCRTGIECFAVMDGRVDLVLDGGHCVGEGSTTVDITEPYWRMIKEGSITEKEIAETLKT
jgi:L-threonylcarbamoyladenylate synthase